MLYPATDRLCEMFNARVLENAALSKNEHPFVVSVPTKKMGFGTAGEYLLTPGFVSRETLEKFVQLHMPEYVCLDIESREAGAMTDLFWA